MTRITFSAKQIRSAPPAVRQWVDAQAGATVDEPGPYRRLSDGEPLSACTLAEAEHILALVGEDTLAGRIFLTLGDERAEPVGASHHAVKIGTVVRCSRPADGDQLIDGFYTLSEAFQSLRGKAEATLFGFDPSTHVHVHETSYRSIRALRQRLTAARSAILGVSRYLMPARPADFSERRITSHDVIALPPAALLSPQVFDRSPRALS